jgi:PRTRC genetic system protein E
MFKELRPLLAKRSLTITIAALNGEQIRVNIIPYSRPEDSKANEQIKYPHKDEVAGIPEAAVKALTTPISLTGTPEEIDANLPKALLQFVESHSQLQATFDRACTEISEAVKAIDERNKNKPKSNAASAKTEQKEDPKTRTGDPKPKSDETLPLWWTDSSVAPPGDVTASSGSATGGGAGPQRNSQSTNVQEVVTPCQ